jgi:DNA polymerase-3 subunit alpha
MADEFVHLHVHTEYSMLDGAARITELVEAVKADGQRAVGITDHGNMYGVLDFYKECRANDINPIIGTEAYMAYDSRRERPTRKGRVDDTGGDGGEGRKLYYHLTLLAENNTGYRNLMKASSMAYLEGYYYKPRLDWELLERYHEGLIATSGCLGGVVCQDLLRSDYDGALKKAGRLQDIFGRDNFFVELQDHGIDEQHKVMPGLVSIAQHLGAPMLATNDSHYTCRDDAEAHDALLCVQTGATIDDPNRFKFHGNEHYVKSAAEMRSLFSSYEGACDSTLWIAERCKVEIEFGKPQLPNFPLPAEFDDESTYLRTLTIEGARLRYGSEIPAVVMQRIDYELGVIDSMGFSAYFLIVWDLIRYARESNIRVGPGRGSAAGCAVAYCLRITDLDPIKYDLLFERFLNPSRISMPDIDMDFDDRYRGRMIAYATEKYGWDHVAQIVTFSTIKARAAVRDAARVLGLDYGLGDRIAKAMPPVIMGRDTPLRACLEEDPKYADGYKQAVTLREMYEADPDAKRVVDVARGLEGLRRGDGIHAAAVVITREPLTEYLPVQRKPEPGADVDTAPIVTQYEMHGVEDLGLLKMDFLGLRNLSVIEMALDLIQQSTGTRVDIDNVPLDDPKVFEMLGRGDSIGVFQLEGDQMRTLMRALAPTSFEDIAALVALYRPGPMAANMHFDYADRKNGRKPVTYIHEDLEPLLADTYGLMIFQESVMRVAQKFAGYSLAEADNLRKACAKKVRAMIVKERGKFVAGCEATGYGESIGTQLFDIIEPFADYAFPKSHSFGYGFISYQTAWLKANYPVEYIAALLTSTKDNQEKMTVYLVEARNQKVEIGVPNINSSSMDFSTVVGDDGVRSITFGLSAIRNVGEGLVAKILADRDANGPFSDFYDFCERVDTSVLNKKAVEALTKAGAFDVLGHPRRGLLGVYEEVVDKTVARRRERDQGILSLFGDDPISGGGFDDSKVDIPDIEYDRMTKLAFEKEMLGFYVSDHPLGGAEHVLRRYVEFNIGDLESAADGDIKMLGGISSRTNRRYTRKGDLMATFTLEDLTGITECWLFPKAMAELGHLLGDDAIMVVKARIDKREDLAKLIVMDIRRPEIISDGGPPLRLNIPATRLTDHLIESLKAHLTEYPGPSAVFLHMGDKVVRLPDQFCVDNSARLVGELRVLLGADGVL